MQLVRDIRYRGVQPTLQDTRVSSYFYELIRLLTRVEQGPV